MITARSLEPVTLPPDDVEIDVVLQADSFDLDAGVRFTITGFTLGIGGSSLSGVEGESLANAALSPVPLWSGTRTTRP